MKNTKKAGFVVVVVCVWPLFLVGPSFTHGDYRNV